MQNTFKTKIITSLFLIFSTILMIAGPLISSEFSSQSFTKQSNAAPVVVCSPSEILTGGVCVTNRISNPTYGLQCETGYTPAEATCIQFTQKTCADYPHAIPAETGYCKLDPLTTIYAGEILDYDGRTCNINGGVDMWFLRYNVTLPFGSTSGPIVCASVFITSIVGGTLAAPNFRFIPRNVSSIHNFVTAQTGAILSPCPTGYTNLGTNQCSRPTVINSCNAGGEIAIASSNSVTCAVCPAGQYCQTTSNITTTFGCPNGGTPVTSLNNKCQLANAKYSYTSYSDGCAAGYIRLDQSCAVKQFRDRDVDACSYFFASSNVFQLAVETPAGSGICSTGGSTDFASTDIQKTDDTLQCAGPGSGWYNYNVAYDPLVCGQNTYDPNNKAAFRWTAATYSKITGLQKLPSTSTACPNGWTEVSASSQDCLQDPVTLSARTGTACPANSYCPESSTNPTPCPTNYTSPTGSDALADCTPNPCTNGGINPPTCNCPTSQTLVNGTCINNCTNGATNPPNCNNQSSSSISSSSISSSSNSSSSISSSSSSNCTSAQPGYFIDGTKCSPCVAGYYCPGTNIKPIICPIGYYCPVISATATICPQNRTTRTEGAKDVSECIAIAQVAVAPTPRSGGNQLLLTGGLAFITIASLSGFYIFNRPKSLQEWIKIK